ncbi:MAG: sugar phosphate isomerase/epimerase [Gemmatimonadota bacterium]|nr:MAG: sugar phosphate isomerase/epimerase [Gemmatimonadota bacterium]
MTTFRVGIDSYCLNPRRMDPFAVLDWVAGHGGQGVQFSEVHLSEGQVLDAQLLEDLASAASELGLYLEWGGGQHVPFDTNTWSATNLLPGNRRAAEQANALGARIVRSCSGGFFRWDDATPPTEELLQMMADALRPQRRMFEQLGVTLAIELHFEFTTFELLRLFEMCDAEPGGWLGVCLDTFNVLPLLEDPVAATSRILPWVVATHVKDGGLLVDRTGLVSFPVVAGGGLVDLSTILGLLVKLDRPLNLSLEDHGGVFTTPLDDESFLQRFPDLTVSELSHLITMAQRGRELMDAGELAITERERWPELCEGRTQMGLRNLQKLVASLAPET